MLITIKRLDGSTLQMEVDEKQIVAHLKQFWAERTGLKTSQLQFMHKDAFLLDFLTLGEQQVKSNDTLYVLLWG